MLAGPVTDDLGVRSADTLGSIADVWYDTGRMGTGMSTNDYDRASILTWGNVTFSFLTRSKVLAFIFRDSLKDDRALSGIL